MSRVEHLYRMHARKKKAVLCSQLIFDKTLSIENLTRKIRELANPEDAKRVTEEIDEIAVTIRVFLEEFL